MEMGLREWWTGLDKSGVWDAGLLIYTVDVDLTTLENSANYTKYCLYIKISLKFSEIMKGDRKRRRNFFKKGHNYYPRDTKFGFNDDGCVRYVRPTPEEADLVDQNPIQGKSMKAEADISKPAVTYKLLRSIKPKKNDHSLDAKESLDQKMPHAGYRLFHTGKLWEMINTVVKQHNLHSNTTCTGNLGFDFRQEVKWGSCWSERVICDKCTYSSPMFKLYEEVKSKKAGRKAATANLGLGVGLTQTSAGPSSVVKLYASCNIPPPSRQGLQRSSAAVNRIIQDANLSDMQARRQQLKTINKYRNNPENEIVIQADGQYNNNLYSGVGRTPFQPGTQCTYTIAENITHKKQIIALETVNKLCSKHGYHSMEDEACDIKSGTCSANTSMETCIGDEEEWAKSCLKDLKKDGLEAKYIVTDPDTSAHRAAETLYAQGATQTKPYHQIDTRHLSQNHRKYMKNSDQVLSMMPGRTQAYRQLLRNRFSVDMSMRCQAEYSAIHTSEMGDFENIVPRIRKCIAAIKHCYSGDHTRCKVHSSVCKGESDNNWIVKSAFVTKNFKIDLTPVHNEQTLLDCIHYRLGDEMLEKTKLNLNSQKVEATNRAIRRSLPKTLTFARNFPGRAHSAIHSVNNGMGVSLRKLCAAAGCPIVDGSRVERSLTAAQLAAEKNKTRMRSMDYRIKRKLRRNRLYAIYDKHRENKKYISAQLLKSKKMSLKRCPSSKSGPKSDPAASTSDHVYARTTARHRSIRGRGRGKGGNAGLSRLPSADTDSDPCSPSEFPGQYVCPASKPYYGRGGLLPTFGRLKTAAGHPRTSPDEQASMPADG